MPPSGPPVRELISVLEAREGILRASRTLGVEETPLHAAVGRVLRENVVSDVDIPPFDNSAMDGFAVSLSDFDGEHANLIVQEDIPAGHWPSSSVGDGRCARIMTGAPVPDGTDAVVPVEWCRGAGEVGSSVTMGRRPEPGQHIRRRGSDIKEGDLALEAPLQIEPHTIGVLASLGYGEVGVAIRPSVAVVATGDELVDASETPTGGRIRNSNGPTLAQLAVATGAVLSGEYVARDEVDHTRKVLGAAMEADIVVISGGVSVGSYDYVKEVLDEMGLRRLFWRVKQRPGKPLTFGTIGDRLVFGLPGNPVSTAVCFRQYVRPAIRKILGLSPGPKFVSARLEEAIRKAPDLHFFVPGRAAVDEEGRLTVRKSGAFGSHIFSSMAAANCLISIPEGPETVGTGSRVDVELMGPI